MVMSSSFQIVDDGRPVASILTLVALTRNCSLRFRDVGMWASGLTARGCLSIRMIRSNYVNTFSGVHTHVASKPMHSHHPRRLFNVSGKGNVRKCWKTLFFVSSTMHKHPFSVTAQGVIPKFSNRSYI